VTPLYPQKLALTSPTGGGRYVGIVRVRTKATEFSLLLLLFNLSRQCSGYYIHRQCVYSLPAGEVIKRVSYVFLYFGNTVLAIGHTLGFSHKQTCKMNFSLQLWLI